MILFPSSSVKEIEITSTYTYKFYTNFITSVQLVSITIEYGLQSKYTLRQRFTSIENGEENQKE